MAKIALTITKEEEALIREAVAMQQDIEARFGEMLLKELEATREGLDSFKKSNKKMHEAYMRIRQMLRAFNTPTAPTSEQIYTLTELTLSKFIQGFACEQCHNECIARGHQEKE